MRFEYFIAAMAPLVAVLIIALILELVESYNYYTTPPRNAPLHKIRPFKRGKK